MLIIFISLKMDKLKYVISIFKINDIQLSILADIENEIKNEE